MADPEHPRRFGEELERQIVQPCDNDRSPGEIRAKHDIGSSTLHRWMRWGRRASSSGWRSTL